MKLTHVYNYLMNFVAQKHIFQTYVCEKREAVDKIDSFKEKFTADFKPMVSQRMASFEMK